MKEKEKQNKSKSKEKKRETCVRLQNTVAANRKKDGDQIVGEARGAENFKAGVGGMHMLSYTVCTQTDVETWGR